MRVSCAREHLRKHRRRERAAGHAMLGDRPRVIEAEPHTGDDIRRHADEPDVGVVVGRARLARDGHLGRQVPAHRRRGSALHHVAHHVAHDEGDGGIERGRAGANILRVHRVAAAIFHTIDEARLHGRPEVREGRVRIDEVERLHN